MAVDPRPALARFAVIGDYGIDSPQEAAVAKMVAGWNPDFVITTGDNNYPLGEASTIDKTSASTTGGSSATTGAAFGPGSAINRFWPSPGNHDWDTGSLSRTSTTSRCPVTGATTTSSSARFTCSPSTAIPASRTEPAKSQCRRAGWRRRSDFVGMLPGRLLSPPWLTPPACTARVWTCAGHSRPGGQISCSPDTITSTSVPGWGHPPHHGRAQRQRALYVWHADRPVGGALRREAGRLARDRA